MALENLIKNQIIRVDNHKRGTGEENSWGKGDLHIDKRTNCKINGEKVEIIIKLPINSNREKDISIRRKKGKQKIDQIPPKIDEEIRNAFSDKRKREHFIDGFLKVIDNFSGLDSFQKAEEALSNLSKHFNLRWTREEISILLDGQTKNLKRYTEYYKGKEGKKYLMGIDKEKERIIVGEKPTKRASGKIS